MNKEYRNYNVFALRGDTETSDLDVCEQLGLSPDLAGTPEINEAAIRKMHKQNYEQYINNGSTEQDAMNLANEKANDVRKQVRELI